VYLPWQVENAGGTFAIFRPNAWMSVVRAREGTASIGELRYARYVR
jgi:hypothetical protein